MQIIDGSQIERVTKPGIYSDIPADFYHSQRVTDGPSLSSSTARTMLDDCPAVVKHERDSGGREPTKAFDIGTAAHLITLEPELFEAEIARIDAKDYRSKAAQEARNAAREEGRTPLLPHEVEQLEAMREALGSHPIARDAFRNGIPELSVFTRLPSGLWIKARPDYTHRSGSMIVDYKTSTTAHPREFTRKAVSLGYHQQAAWYIDTWQAVTGERPSFWFVAQDKSAPYLTSVFRFDDDAIEAGRRLNARALEIYQRCLSTGEWPGYTDGGTYRPFTMSLPAWALEKAIEE